ncbi:MAG: VanZ family protein, partial [Candidatus Hydrogenedentota bacterium]
MQAWSYAVVMMACILISLPITPILWRAGAKTLGPHFDTTGYVVLLLIIVGFAIHMIRHRHRFGILGFLLLSALALVYLCLLKYHCRFPAERLHLMEYGLLAYLLYKALRFDLPRAKAYLLGFLISSAFGFFDEVIQHILPNRVFEVRDVMTNLIASALGLLVVAVLLRAKSPPILQREAD